VTAAADLRGRRGAVPLLLVAAVANGAGLLTAEPVPAGTAGLPAGGPGLECWLVVGGALLVALGVTASTLPSLPSLERIIGPETARNG
jgi:hypothetical protein